MPCRICGAINVLVIEVECPVCHVFEALCSSCRDRAPAHEHRVYPAPQVDVRSPAIEIPARPTRGATISTKGMAGHVDGARRPFP